MWPYFLCSCLIVVSSLVYNYFNVEKPMSFVQVADERYDYIVVGAGTAGCVVASLLSNNKNNTVLLVEAGSSFNWLTSTIPMAAVLQQLTEVDWAYKTEAQYYSSKGFQNYSQAVPRGKGLGGSGQLNFMLHSFGVAEDYEEWPKEWSHDRLHSYFKSVESKMNVVSAGNADELQRASILAFTSMSTRRSNIVAEKATATIKNGTRWSSFHAYLKRSWNRRNLHILQNTLVAKLNFHGAQADGVTVKYKDNSLAKIRAAKEVILCAGTIGTPQLLMLSGIGPIDQLQKFKIPIVTNSSEVGQNLFDHLNVPIYVNLQEKISLTLGKVLNIPQVFKYMLQGTGHLASNGIVTVARENESGLMLFSVASTDERGFKKLSNYETEIFQMTFPSHNDTEHEGFVYLASCLQPASRGSITLRSNSIEDHPAIDPSYLAEAEDVFCTHEAIKLAVHSLNAKSFRKIGATVHVPDFEMCRHLRQDYRDIFFAECVMRTIGISGYHLGGTCRMGDDDLSVVDERLRVRGVRGLRIMDASVLPSPISGFPNSVIIAMAERAVDMILNQV